LVIQTAEPNHHALQALVRADYSYFLTRELEQRKELTYPPYVEIVKVSIDGAGASEVVEQVRAEVSAAGDRVLGPIEVARDNRTPSLQLLIKTSSAAEVAATLRVILEGVPKGTRMSVDVDPR
jgi:primosomal protein N' (replication factor Y)